MCYDLVMYFFRNLSSYEVITTCPPPAFTVVTGYYNRDRVLVLA